MQEAEHTLQFVAARAVRSACYLDHFEADSLLALHCLLNKGLDCLPGCKHLVPVQSTAHMLLNWGEGGIVRNHLMVHRDVSIELFENQFKTLVVLHIDFVGGIHFFCLDFGVESAPIQVVGTRNFPIRLRIE